MSEISRGIRIKLLRSLINDIRIERRKLLDKQREYRIELSELLEIQNEDDKR